MKKKIQKRLLIFVGLTILLIISSLLFYRFAPGQFLKLRASFYEYKAGLKESSLEVDKYRWFYYHNDNQKNETIVFVHGFTASKLFWLEFASFFKEYNIIIPDLPGHGKTTYFENENYSIKENTKRLNSFLEKIGVKKFYIVGISLGGAIAGYYTYLYPDKVKKLVLIDAAGAKAEKMSPYFQYILTTGENLLIFKDKEGFKKMFSFLIVKPTFVPDHIIDYYIEEKKKMNPRYEKIFSDLINEINQDGPVLNERVLNSINTPTLIIWGKEDKIIDVSAAYNINKGIKNSVLFIIDNIGHVPPVEAKEVTASKIIEFIKN